jgi:two-component system OmpR family response regulator
LHVLIVEDDAKLVRALERGLKQEGYSADVARSGDDALPLARDGHYDAVVLDVMLPGLDGFEVCRELRRAGRRTPVLMLTARADVPDRIRGLDAGADDYLVKPFDFGELVARLRALVRRGPIDPEPVIEVGSLRVDPDAHVVTRNGRTVELTAREFVLLEFLARNAGRVVSREQLLDHVWQGNRETSPNIVDVYIGYLRKKLDAPSEPQLIRTVRGVGFKVQ